MLRLWGLDLCERCVCNIVLVLMARVVVVLLGFWVLEFMGWWGWAL